VNLLSIPKLGELAKLLAPRVLFTVALFCAVVLFLPTAVLGRLGLVGLRDTKRAELGAAFVLSIGLMLADGSSKLVKWSRQTAAKWRVLKRLTPQEQALLRRYLQEDTGTLNLSYQSGIVNGLQAKGILYRASTITDGSLEFPYNLQPWARDRLRRRPALVGATKGSLGRRRRRAHRDDSS